MYRSLNHIYAQVIDDQKGETLVSASSLIKLKTGGNVAAAKEIGKAVAEKAVEEGHQEGGLRSRRLSCITGASRRWPMRRAKQAWSSKSS